MYAFIADWNLVNIGILQTALYAIIILAAGVFFLQRNIHEPSMACICIAMSGVVMINWK